MAKFRVALACLAFLGTASLVEPALAQYGYGQGYAPQDRGDPYSEMRRRQRESGAMRHEGEEEVRRRQWESEAVRRGELDRNAVMARRRAWDAQREAVQSRVQDRREGYEERASRRRYWYGQ